MSIKSLRQESGKTQREVSAAVGVTERTYIRWEQGDVRPDAGNLVGLLDFFRLALDRPALEGRDLLESEAETVPAAEPTPEVTQ